MASPNNKLKKGGQEITLMTVLANEATGSSRKLLNEYGMPDAKNYQDLEIKLAELYFNTKDKVALEKRLAAIHPHKNWILRNVQPVIEEKSKQELIEEVKSNADGQCMCPRCQRRNNCEYSNAEGDVLTNRSEKVQAAGLVGPMMILGLISIVMITLLKASPNFNK